MSRTFVAASSQYLETASIPVTVAPFSMAAWIKPTANIDQIIVSMVGVGTVGFYLRASAGGVVLAQQYDGSGNGIASATGTLTAGAWAHVGGVFTSNSSRTAYRDGANAATNSTVCTTPTTTSCNIGCQNDTGARANFFGGLIAEVGIWNVALDAAEMASLAAGVSPLLIRPTALIAYWPLIGQTSPEIELRGRRELTVSGATAGAHARILYPTFHQVKATTGRVTTGAADISFRINLVERTSYVSRLESEIVQAPYEVPDTATVMVRGFVPLTGQRITITSGASLKLFDGVIADVIAVQPRAGTRVRYRLHCVDWTFLLNRLLVNWDYASQSASTTAADLIGRFTNGFTTGNVEAALASVELPNKMETLSQALTRLSNLVGAFWYVDYDRDLHFRITENLTNPATLDTTSTTFRELEYAKSVIQVRTRVSVEGGGVTALAEVAIGETVLPVVDVAWYSTLGGTVITGSQVISYTGVVVGGGGSLVGPGATPASAPALAAASGAGLTDGVYKYAYTDVTASGESLPSPLGTFTVSSAPTPPVAPGALAAGPYDSILNDGVTQGAGYKYVATYSYATGSTDHSNETAISPVSDTIVPVANLNHPGHTSALYAVAAKSTDPAVKWVHMWRTAPNGSTYKLQGSFSNSGSPWYVGGYDQVSDATVAAAISAPGAATAVFAQVAVSGIAIGASPTTSRKVYRTVVNGSQLKLHTTVANNTATTIANDAIADGSLGANAPTSDTSALTQPDGQVLAGATTILVAGAGAFTSAGGWAIIGNGQQVIRYTGITDNTLTGVPASGVGAITATVAYNSTITTAPALTGITASGTGSIRATIKNGDAVNILVITDNTDAQTALAALEGGDGIHEHYIQDRRLSLAGASARGTAELTLGKDPDEIATFISEDANMCVGRSVTINISGISTTLKIQKVRIFWTADRALPQREVTATNRFKDFYQYVRDIEDKASKAS